jgi:hypothetical protein
LNPKILGAGCCGFHLLCLGATSLVRANPSSAPTCIYRLWCDQLDSFGVSAKNAGVYRCSAHKTKRCYILRRSLVLGRSRMRVGIGKCVLPISRDGTASISGHVLATWTVSRLLISVNLTIPSSRLSAKAFGSDAYWQNFNLGFFYLSLAIRISSPESSCGFER